MKTYVPISNRVDGWWHLRAVRAVGLGENHYFIGLHQLLRAVLRCCGHARALIHVTHAALVETEEGIRRPEKEPYQQHATEAHVYVCAKVNVTERADVDVDVYKC